MTQLTVVGTRTRERTADERLYRFLYILGFSFYLPVVVLRRSLFGFLRRPDATEGPPRNNSMLAEVRAEVDTVLAFVFMV